MNRVIISGRFTKEHELKITPNGTSILSNTIASNRKFKNAEGNYEADFVNVVLFNNQAKFIADYSKKGDMALIEGRLQTRNYDNSEGKKVWVTEVVADSVELLTPKKEQTTNNNQTNNTSSVITTKEDPFATFGQSVEITDNDLPF